MSRKWKPRSTEAETDLPTNLPPESGSVTAKAIVFRAIRPEDETGTYDVDFDAAGLTNGTYLYRLQFKDAVQIRRLVLLSVENRRPISTHTFSSRVGFLSRYVEIDFRAGIWYGWKP